MNWETMAQAGAAGLIALALIKWLLVPGVKAVKDDLAAARVERQQMRVAYEELATGTVKRAAEVITIAGEHMKASADKSAQVCEGMKDMVESQKSVKLSLDVIAKKMNGGS